MNSQDRSLVELPGFDRQLVLNGSDPRFEPDQSRRHRACFVGIDDTDENDIRLRAHLGRDAAHSRVMRYGVPKLNRQ